MRKTTLAVLAAGLLLTACDDSDNDGDGPSGGSGAVGGTGGETSGSGGTADGGSGGGAAACPLDDTGKLRVAAIAASSGGTATWILMNTHGHGAGAGRGFGTVVPMTSVAALYSASLAEACTAPSRFAPYCEVPPPGEPAEPFTRCSQLVCDGAGQMTAEVWLDGLPATVPSDPPPGETTMVATAHSTHFVETGTDAIELSWEGAIEVSFGDGASASWTGNGAGSVDGMTSSATTSDEITGLTAEPITIELALGDDGPSGQIDHAGAAIALVDHDGLEWVGACAP